METTLKWLEAVKGSEDVIKFVKEQAATLKEKNKEIQGLEYRLEVAFDKLDAAKSNEVNAVRISKELEAEVKRLNVQLSAASDLAIEKQKEAQELRGAAILLNMQIAALEEAMRDKDEEILVTSRQLNAAELEVKSWKKSVSDIFDLVKAKNAGI